MKIPNLRAKIKPKRCKGNIHFGKVVLTFMLVGMMILGNVEPVKASEPLYYYDRHIIAYSYSNEVVDIPNSGVFKYAWEIDNEYTFYEERTVYSSYIEHTGEIIPDGYIHHWASSAVNVGQYVVENSSGKSFKISDKRSSGGSTNRSYDFEFSHGKQVQSVRGSEKGEYIKTVTGTYNQYPTNGVHLDGYWYVRKGLVNNNPTLSISSPSENSYFV